MQNMSNYVIILLRFAVFNLNKINTAFFVVGGIDMIGEKYDEFIVYTENDNYSFVHINIEKTDFYELLFKYFFSEERLLKYVENKENIRFTPTKRNYSKLFKNLKKFVDEENTIFDKDKFVLELKKFMNVDNENDESLLKFRKDKVGKIGEYIFSIILLEYFNMQCIIPKLTMITDPNMSVFGIDTIFYNKNKKMLLFGESKFYSKLNDGVTALKKSLISYEKQIEDEYYLVLSNTDNYKMPIIENNYIESIEECFTFKEFIEKENIKSLGIPLFIMHGGKFEMEEIIKEFNKIEKKSLFNLNTIYYCISLPILNKDKFKAEFLKYIYERIKEYEQFK